jgi:hypothetical protein
VLIQMKFWSLLVGLNWWNSHQNNNNQTFDHDIITCSEIDWIIDNFVIWLNWEWIDRWFMSPPEKRRFRSLTFKHEIVNFSDSMTESDRDWEKNNGISKTKWRDIRRDDDTGEQKSAPNVCVEQLTALSYNRRSLEEQETIPNRGALAGLTIPWRVFLSLRMFIVISFDARIVLHYQCFKRRLGKGFMEEWKFNNRQILRKKLSSNIFNMFRFQLLKAIDSFQAVKKSPKFHSASISHLIVWMWFSNLLFWETVINVREKLSFLAILKYPEKRHP